MKRIDCFLSELKYGTRSEIPNLIRAGKVTHNGYLVTSPKIKIDPEKDEVLVDGEKVFYKKTLVLMLNKPNMTESSNVDGIHPSVLNLIEEPYSRFELNIAGRLDSDAEGLLLLTNDGSLLHRIISPSTHVTKTYLVELSSPLGDYSLLLEGVTILDGKNDPYTTAPAQVIPIDEYHCKIMIGEGKFHQVKRMFEYIGNHVTSLKRIAIGNLPLDSSLGVGEYRELTTSEIEDVFKEKKNL